MARPREFDEGKALEAAMNVFWERGYDAASYGALMTATGLGKGSLYAAFGDKSALYARALEHYLEDEIQTLAGALTSEGAPMDQLTALMDYAIAAVEARGDRRGCFLCNAAVDRAHYGGEVERIVTEAMATCVGAIEGVAAAAGRAGEGEHLFSVFLGIRVMAKAGLSPDAMRRARDAALAPRPLN